MMTLVDQVTEVLWAAFDEQVCVDRSLSRICDTGDHDFDMTQIAEQVIAAMQPEITAEAQRRYRQGAADNSWHMP